MRSSATTVSTSVVPSAKPKSTNRIITWLTSSRRIVSAPLHLARGVHLLAARAPEAEHLQRRHALDRVEELGALLVVDLRVSAGSTRKLRAIIPRNSGVSGTLDQQREPGDPIDRTDEHAQQQGVAMPTTNWTK